MALYAPTLRPSEAGHWYDRNGGPIYEVANKDGSMRPATLREARKYGLVPGVSSILRMEAKPGLVNWQIEQALMSALTLPRVDGETDDVFIERAREDSKQQVIKAAERGTEIHAAVQGFFDGKGFAAKYGAEVEAVRGWCAQRYGLADWWPEKSFSHPAGFGGKADLISQSRGVVIDFKCKDFGPEKDTKWLAWPDHAMQLAAYAHGFGFQKPDCVNVFISTREPGLIRVYEWDYKDIAKGMRAFLLLLELWKLRKDFDSSYGSRAAA
jgi:hypothetical protein